MESIIYGLSATLCFFLLITWYKHILEVEKFRNKVIDLVESFVDNYEVNVDYFQGLIENRKIMWLTPWTRKFENYIVDEDKFQELLKASKEIVVELDENEYACPWCDGYKFETVLHEKINLYTVVCKDCGGSTPVCDSEEECYELLKK